MKTLHQAQVNDETGYAHLSIKETLLGYTSVTVMTEENQTENRATIYLSAEQWAELAVAAQNIADKARVKGVGNFDGTEILLNQDVLDSQAAMEVAARTIPALAETR